jgi:predicted dehydrogenase
MIRLGIVDCDTSHVVAYSQRLHHKGVPQEQWVDGARIIAAFQGTSQVRDLPTIEGYVRTLREEHDVEIVDQPSDLIGKVDAVLVESNEGAPHAGHAVPFLERGIPVFVDKPFAGSVADARRMVDAARRGGTFVWSASSLRYALEVQDVQRRREELGAVVGADAYSPATLHPRNPGLLHYGVHGVEMLYALMGTGCQTVRCVSVESADVVVGRWADGRLGTVRGLRQGPHDYGFTAFCEKAVVPARVDAAYIYRELLRRIVEAFQSGKAPLDAQELVEPMAFMEAALESSRGGGAEVAVQAGTPPAPQGAGAPR